MINKAKLFAVAALASAFALNAAAENSLVEMVRIPGGTFLMGSPPDEIGRWGNEGPQRQVTISPFYMGRFPVTQEQWTAVMGGNPSFFSWGPAPGEVQGRRPVESVSWYAVLVFANRLSIMEGFSPAYSIGGSTNPDDWGPLPSSRDAAWDAVEIVAGSTGFRLPTEAQWEHAARAGTATAFSNGAEDWSDAASIYDIGWFSFNSGEATRQAGLLAANPWGLYDMHGNVFEWVWDWFGGYPAEAQTNPAVSFSGTFRVIRGGNWSHSAQFARSAYRSANNPAAGGSFLGFRLARP
ncbi:MAG: formylglycine-generating enzyme family protein [Spirochaetes bacterium]|nr:formylglycine-generating enzyme family protein [Spirochaetota bacterium]